MKTKPKLHAAPTRIEALLVLKTRLEQGEERVRQLWTKGGEALEDAAMELGVDLEMFTLELDRDPFFGVMPRLSDHFEYLWALFLHWGTPSPCEPHEESSLGGLTQSEVFLAFASEEYGVARYFLHEDAAAQGWSTAVAQQHAARCLRAAERAIAFAERCGRETASKFGPFGDTLPTSGRQEVTPNS